MAAKLKAIDEYLAKLGADKRSALEKLRRDIQAAAPQAEECISYQLPAFRLNGRFLVAFGAATKHCAFYPASKPILVYANELKKYDTSKGAIRFSAAKPLPAALVRKLVKVRMGENEDVAKPRAAGKKRGAAIDPAVVAFLAKLDHPLKKEIEALRQIILGVSPKISEGIKWNAPSFKTTDYFATVNLRGKSGEERIWLILHTGAKAKNVVMTDVKNADPDGLLKWLAKDRCLLTFVDGKDVKAKKAALVRIVRAWIQHLRGR